MEMHFLSEYNGANRTAWVCRRPDLNDYVMIGYINGLERESHPFPSERMAEDAAEDWVNG